MKKFAAVVAIAAVCAVSSSSFAARKHYAPAPVPAACAPACAPVACAPVACAPACGPDFNPFAIVGGVVTGVGSAIGAVGNGIASIFSCNSCSPCGY